MQLVSHKDVQESLTVNVSFPFSRMCPQSVALKACLFLQRTLVMIELLKCQSALVEETLMILYCGFVAYFL